MEIINPETLEKVSGGGLVSDMMGPSFPGEEPQKPEENPGFVLIEIGFSSQAVKNVPLRAS